MSEVPDIGGRIRIERDARGWSLADCARRAGISRAMLHKVEQGQSSPTAALLARISAALGLTMSELIVRAERPHGRLLRQKEQAEWIDPASGYRRRQVSPRIAAPLEVVRVELPPGAEIAMPAASYALQRHLFWVIEGQLVFMEGKARHELDVGDSLTLGPPADCIFRNERAEPCIYLVVLLSEHGRTP